MRDHMTEAATLPRDGTAGALAGRVWRPDVDGPSVVAVRADGVHDISRHAATMRDLCEAADPAKLVREADGERIGTLADILANTPEAAPQRRQAVAAGADRSAGHQGGRRHVRPLDGGARDRGAGQGRA